MSSKRIEVDEQAVVEAVMAELAEEFAETISEPEMRWRARSIGGGVFLRLFALHSSRSSRDEFAKAALAGMSANGDLWRAHGEWIGNGAIGKAEVAPHYARMAYEIADAMLAEREECDCGAVSERRGA